MIIGITGQCIDSLGRKRIAGAGKDVVAKRLVENHKFVSLAWADPFKRFCQEVYGFSDEALWGESDARIIPDKRFPRADGTFLSPREALQSIGSGWGRACYLNTWVDYGIRTAKKILLCDHYYTPNQGLIPVQHPTVSIPKVNGVVFSDVRFMNELYAIKEAGGLIVRVKRQLTTSYDEKAMNLLHDSETELANKEDDLFDHILDNSGTLDDLMEKIDSLVKIIGIKDIPTIECFIQGYNYK